MKIRCFTFALVGFTLSAGALRAQEASASPSPAPTLAPLTDKADKAGKEKGGGRRAERMQALTPEEQTKLREAHKAARQDPAVKAAEAQRASDPKAYQQAVNEAMIRKDPSIKAILEKLQAGHGGKKNKG